MSRALSRLVSRCARTFEQLLRFRERYHPRPGVALGVHRLEARETPSVGGGFTDQGLTGTYYSDNNFTTAAFTRKDVRLDFDWGTAVKPGGSTSPGYRDVGTDNFSARWFGQLIPKFSETYTFSGFADDVFKLEVKTPGPTAYTTVVDQTAFTGANFSGTYAMTAGQKYDVRISFRELGGPAAVRLLWASPSTPAEVIDPVNQSGINNPDSRSAFTDLVKGARNSWEPVDGGPTPGTDANGWPTGNGSYVFQESLNQGLDVDPLARGRVQFSFTGKADVSVWGNVEAASLTFAYAAGTNTTSGSFLAANKGSNASVFTFRNSTRTGVAGGPAGITNLKLILPRVPDATANNYAADEQFTSHIKDAMGKFTVVRHQYVANQQKEWADRTRPAFFNQGSGTRTAPTYTLPWDSSSDNLWSWEHKVMLANETGRDLMLSLPPLASNDYITKLANLLRYGSDGVNPYTAPTTNPLYPPLNTNLRVYLEIGNELWNYAGVFYTDYNNINQLVANASPADRAAITYDGVTDENVTRYRYILLRTKQISDTFRGVFGGAAMPGNGNNANARVRPLYEWQYDNQNGTADRALTWADRYFNKADPASTYAGSAVPLNSYLWGGGGAAYYGAVNGNGLTALLGNPAFGNTAVPNGYTQNPAGSGWAFAGTAGIARDAGTGDDIPTAYAGNQMGYIAGTGRVTATFTVPTSQTSDLYSVAFKAHNRRQVGATENDGQNLRVYLDYGTAAQQDITARTFNQGDGYTPPSYDQMEGPWNARNVFWTESQYYYGKAVPLAAGSTHTVTVVGTGVATQVAFLGEVRVTSVDKVFADGIPGGGEATGQPAGLNIRNTMNVSNSWAAAFGLKHLAYESGWSLGGDDGGSPIQLKAKYGDPRTADAQKTFMDYYAAAGGEVDVFGTYAQWPNWTDFYAEQGLLNVGSYPIMQGIQNRSDNLEVDPTNGNLATGVFDRTNITLGANANTTTGQISGTAGWLSWNVIAPRSGRYVLSANTGGGGTAVLLVDDAAVASGASGGTLSGTVFLTKGLHAVKVRSASGGFAVNTVGVVGENAPAAPAVSSLTENGGTAALNWGAVSGVSGYVVRYGTARGQYTQRIDAGNVTSLNVPGLAHNTVYYFAVSAYNAAGSESLPSAARSVIVLTPNTAGTVMRYDFTGLVGNEASVPVDASGSKVTVSTIARGPGLSNGAYVWPNVLASDPAAAAGNVYGTDLASTIAKNQYYQFTLTPAAGQKLNLSQLRFFAAYQFADPANPNNGSGAGITYSTNGTTFSGGLQAVGTPDPGQASTPFTVDLSGQTALQNATGTVTFRVFLYTRNPYTFTLLGRGGPDAITVNGSVAPTTTTSLGTFTAAGDIGGPGVAGSSSFSTANSTYTVVGGGADIWGTADQFQFVRKSLSGNQTITARVSAQGNSDFWAKAGVMFRESNTAGSRFVMVVQMPNGEVAMQWRDATSGSADWSGARVGGATPGKWVRLVKSGNNFTGQYSTDGANWTTIATHTTAFAAANYFGGLGVTAHNNTTTSTATFTNVAVTAGAAAPAFANGSFENTSANGFTYLPTGTGWAFAGNSGLQANGSAWGATTAPAGTQTAFLQSGGAGYGGVNGSVSQTLNFTAAGTFTLSFQSALRGYKGGTTVNQQVGVYLDGVLVQTVSPTATTWATFAVGLTVGTVGNHTVELRAMQSVGDTSLFLDDVRWV